jgi:hypothetical protein
LSLKVEPAPVVMTLLNVATPLDEKVRGAACAAVPAKLRAIAMAEAARSFFMGSILRDAAINEEDCAWRFPFKQINSLDAGLPVTLVSQSIF